MTKNERLIAGVKAGDLDAVTTAIAAGANVNSLHRHLGYNPRPALDDAIHSDSPEIVDLLIQHGADVNSCKLELLFESYNCDPREPAPIDVACRIIDLVFDAGYDPANGYRALCLAATDELVEPFQKLLALGVPVVKIGDQYPPLKTARQDGEQKIVNIIENWIADGHLTEEEVRHAAGPPLKPWREKDFLEIVSAFTDEFTVAAIRANVDAVDRLISRYNNEVPLRRISDNGIESNGTGIVLMQAKDSEWTVINYIIGRYWPQATPHLAALSASLETEGFLHGSEDTSFTEMITFFRSGNKIGEAYRREDGRASSRDIRGAMINGTEELHLRSFESFYKALGVRPLIGVLVKNTVVIEPREAPQVQSSVAYRRKNFNWMV